MTAWSLLLLLDRPFLFRVRARLQHAVLANEEIGVRVFRQPLEQRFQFGPESFSEQRSDFMQLPHRANSMSRGLYCLHPISDFDSGRSRCTDVFTTRRIFQTV